MTTAFLVVLRILLLGLLGYWGFRLWTGTCSPTTRVVALSSCALLAWQILGWSL